MATITADLRELLDDNQVRLGLVLECDRRIQQTIPITLTYDQLRTLIERLKAIHDCACAEQRVTAVPDVEPAPVVAYKMAGAMSVNPDAQVQS